MKRNYLNFFRLRLIECSVIQKNWIVQSGILMLQVLGLSGLLCDRNFSRKFDSLIKQPVKTSQWLKSG